MLVLNHEKITLLSKSFWRSVLLTITLQNDFTHKKETAVSYKALSKNLFSKDSKRQDFDSLVRRYIKCVLQNHVINSTA